MSAEIHACIPGRYRWLIFSNGFAAGICFLEMLHALVNGLPLLAAVDLSFVLLNLWQAKE